MSKQTKASYDPDLPDANAVLASLCCVAARYANRPSAELAQLAASLAHKLTAPQYAESKLVVEVAKRLVAQWEAIMREQNTAMSAIQPASGTLH